MANRQFDAYQAWLGLPREAADADYYRLLGLTRFEADCGKVHAAYEQRHAVVRRYEVGAYAEQALQILEELSAAYCCLTSAARKAEYDEQLRRRLAQTTTAECAAVTEVPVEPPPRIAELVPPPVFSPLPPPPNAWFAAPGEAGGRERLASPADAGQTLVEPVVVTGGMATCDQCGASIPPLENCVQVPVAIDEHGNLRSPLARAVKRASPARIIVDIDAPELACPATRCGPYLTRGSWLVILGALAAAVGLFSVLLRRLVGVDHPAPTAFLVPATLICIAAAWRFYVPRISTGEEAAWAELVPRVLHSARPVGEFAFVSGLAQASFRHAVQRWGGAAASKRRWSANRFQRAAARKRAAVLNRCLARGELLLRTGQIAPHQVAALHRLAIADALTLGASPQRLRPLLGHLFDECLGDGLPLACLDEVLIGIGLYDRLSAVELWRVRLQLYCSCYRRGLAPVDVLALAQRSRALKRLFFVPPEPTVESIACVLALLRVRPQGLAGDGGAAVWEMDSADEQAAWKATPDLLALSRDRTIALQISGFRFRDTLFASLPAVSITQLRRDRYYLRVGCRAVEYAFDPAQEAERVSAWVSLYFSGLLPARNHERARSGDEAVLQTLAGMRVSCPGCERTVALTEEATSRYGRSVATLAK